jgi:hypothetical protein
MGSNGLSRTRVRDPAAVRRSGGARGPFGKWREYNPEETVRFYALRLREAGMVNGTPQKLIAQGTDWRYLNELKRELKA